MNQEIQRKAIRQGLVKRDKFVADVYVGSVVDTMVIDIYVEVVVARIVIVVIDVVDVQL
jgi:hypothetical protein